MQKTLALVILAVLAFAAAAAGDIVYMRGGKKLVGKVTAKDGKYVVKMAYGTVEVAKSDVIYVAYGTGTTMPATSPTPPANDRKPVDPNIHSLRRWNPNEATLPEPLVFMTARRLELLGDAGTDAMRKQLQQWRIAAHDGKRKCGRRWLTREQQRQHRTAFEKRLRQGDEFAHQAWSLSLRSGSDQAKRKKLLTSAEQEYDAAVRFLPDMLMRDFFTGVMDLRNKRYKKADSRFRRCIKAEPLAAAFHQGRGIALSKLKQPLDALAEFVFCLQLRDDTYETIRLVEAAMKDVPGSKLGHPVYLKAKDLLDRYEKPQRPNQTRYSGVVWLMPGNGWQRRRSYRHSVRPDDRQSRINTRFSLFAPPYDRIVSRQALAVPIGADGVLLVDKNAIAGANLLYVQVTPTLLVRATASRQSSHSSRRKDRPDLPLAIIRAEGVTFTPVDFEKSPGPKAEQTVTIRSVNLYRQMGTEIRTGGAKAAADGASLSAGLLPGESMGVVLAGEAFAGLLTARTDPQAKDCGQSSFIKPADLAAWIKPLKRSLDRKTASRGRGPKIKKDIPKRAVTGRFFLVHILLGEKPPAAEAL